MVAKDGDLGPLGDPNSMGDAASGLSADTISKFEAALTEYNAALDRLYVATNDASAAAAAMMSWASVGEKLVALAGPLLKQLSAKPGGAAAIQGSGLNNALAQIKTVSGLFAGLRL